MPLPSLASIAIRPLPSPHRPRRRELVLTNEAAHHPLRQLLPPSWSQDRAALAPAELFHPARFFTVATGYAFLGMWTLMA